MTIVGTAREATEGICATTNGNIRDSSNRTAESAALVANSKCLSYDPQTSSSYQTNPELLSRISGNGTTRNTPDRENPAPRTEFNRRQSSLSSFTPPDGGWGWVVCFASFWVNGTIFSIINTFGIIYVKLKEQFQESGYEDASFLTSLIGSVCVGMTFLLSPLASILTDRYGIQRTAFAGGILATGGMALSSFILSHLEPLYLTYGVLLGAGASLAYTPSLVILGHYFKKRMGLVNGIVTCGSSIFTMIMPLVLKWLVERTGIAGTMQVLSLLLATTMLCALTFRPLIPTPKPPPNEDLTSSKASRILHKIINVSVWKNKRYILWLIAIPSALFGYFVPYVHLVQHVKDILPNENGGVLVTYIGLTSGIGRLVFGKIADYPSVNRIALQQISFVSIGIMTMLLIVANRFEYLAAMCLFMGLFDGCFISLLGPIAFDIVGPSGASQAIGFLLGVCSIPLTAGPPLAGLIYDRTKSYKIAFLLAGVPPLIGAAIMCLMQCKPKRQPSNMPQHPQELPREEDHRLNGADDFQLYNRPGS